MKKQKILIGNWKMNPATIDEATNIFLALREYIGKTKKVQVVICPSSLHINLLKGLAEKSSISIGAQNFFHESKGSYTGEISVDMVADAGATHAIIGHSERRKLGETDDIVNKKIHLALKKKITPVLCIGEATRDEEGNYYSIIKEQLEKSLAGVSRTQLSKLIIAYEPIWAIGATQAMQARDVHEMTIFITKTLVDFYKIKGSVNIPILYGGSVDHENAYSILTEGEADGLLVGRQSLVPESFLEIIRLAQTI